MTEGNPEASARKDDARTRAPSGRSTILGFTLVGVGAAVALAGFLVVHFEPTQAAALRAASTHASTDAANILASERVAYYTKVLAIFTGALAGFAVVQLWFLLRADSIAAESASAATVAARAAEKAAESAGAQIGISGRQVDLLDQQKQIQRLQFFAEHRPKLVLRDVYLTDPSSYDVVSFELSNMGGTAAKIIGGFVAFTRVSSERDFKDPKSWALGTASQSRIEPGEMAVFKCNAATGLATHLRYPGMDRIINLDDPDPPKLAHTYFFGVIQYSDERTDGQAVVRSTVFRRLFHQGDSLFMRTGNPDHEYAD